MSCGGAPSFGTIRGQSGNPFAPEVESPGRQLPTDASAAVFTFLSWCEVRFELRVIGLTRRGPQVAAHGGASGAIGLADKWFNFMDFLQRASASPSGDGYPPRLPQMCIQSG